MVDPAAIDVTNIDGTLRARGEIDGAAPFIAAAEELGAVTHARGFERGSVGLDLVTSDQLPGRVRHKDIVLQLGHEVAPIDAQAGTSGVCPGMGVRRGVRDLERIHPRGRARRGDVFMHLCDASMRVFQHRLIGHDGKHEGVAIRAVEVVTKIIERAAVLPLASSRRDGSGLRVPFEIGAGYTDDLVRSISGVDLFGVKAIVEMHTTIRSPPRRTDLKLTVLGIETFDERFDHVRFAVAIGVLQKQNLRARGGDEPAIVWQQALHVVEVVRKHEALVHAPIPIFVNELRDAGHPGITSVRRTERVVAHLSDEQATLLIPGHFDRVKHQRFSRHQLRLVVAIKLDEFERFLRRERLLLAFTHRDVTAAAGLNGTPFLGETTERMQLILAHDHLRALGLNADAAFRRFAIEGLIHEPSVDEVLQRIALGNDLHAIPLAHRRIRIIWVADVQFVGPVLVPFLPVDATFGDHLTRCTLFPALFFVAI